jgi:hypothetical protein
MLNCHTTLFSKVLYQCLDPSNYHQPTPVMGFSNQRDNQEHIPTLSRFRPMAIDRAAIVTPFKFLKAASASQERLLKQRKFFNVSIDLSSSQFQLYVLQLN